MSDNMAIWKNSAVIVTQLGDWSDEQVDRLLDLNNLGRILSAIIWPDDDIFMRELAKHIVLTDHASRVYSEISELSGIPEYVVKCAFLQSFYHLDLFVDVELTQYHEMRQLIDQSVKDRSARLANRFGRTLYDLYNQTFTHSRTDQLSAEDTNLLLSDTQQGVYQYGKDLLGPLGIIKSHESRQIRANREVPLWHCDDVGCNHLHEVKLSDTKTALRRAHSQIDSYAIDSMGPPSHWGAAISTIEDHFLDDRYGDLFIIVQEQLSKNERTLLLEQLITGESCKDSIWNCIKSSFKKSEYGKPVIAFLESLTEEHLAQLIFIADNESIILSIDDLIRRDKIEIPSTEVRIGKTKFSASQSSCSISSLGIRSDDHNAASSIAEYIWQAYDEAGSLTELSWRALKAAGPATPGTVLQFLNSKTPRDAVSELVLCSSEITQYVRDLLIIELYNNEPVEQLCDRVLWKFGFDVPRYGKEHRNLVRNLDTFRDVLIQESGPFDEISRERIRSAGVNLFVHLENYLDVLIAYNVWLLSNDHFKDKFVYEPHNAKKSVGSVIAAPDAVPWNSILTNTLGVLLTYLSASQKWMESLVGDTELALDRSPLLYPHYADPDDKFFPFHKVAFWANCDQSELQKYITSYGEIVASFLRSELAAVRNGLDHYRSSDKFPSSDMMLACEMRLRQAVSSADVKSFFPKTWWMQTRLFNANGQYEETLTEQEGRVTKLSYPTVLKAIKEVNFGQPAVIPYGNLLGQANSSIVFSVKEESESSRRWTNYPLRRNAIEDNMLDYSNNPSIDKSNK